MNCINLETAFGEYKIGKMSLIQFLRILPDEKERAFEEWMVRLISETMSIEKDLIKILEENQESLKVLYNAFYCICTYYRKEKNIIKYKEILVRYEYCFAENPTYSYLKAMYLMQRGTEADIKAAIKLSQKSMEYIPDNVGIIHCYTEVVAKAFEENILNLKNNKPKLNEAKKLLLSKVLRETYDYAKFHCTYGRLLGISGNYIEAAKEIISAIDKEISDGNYYSLRMAEYQRYLIQVTSKNYEKAILQFEDYNSNMDRWNREMGANIANSIEKVQGALNKNLESLGFFAALVSFIIASVQILTNLNFEDAFELILALGGTMMIVLSGFGIILNGCMYIKRSKAVFGMGVITITLALVIHKFIQ